MKKIVLACLGVALCAVVQAGVFQGEVVIPINSLSAVKPKALATDASLIDSIAIRNSGAVTASVSVASEQMGALVSLQTAIDIPPNSSRVVYPSRAFASEVVYTDSVTNDVVVTSVHTNTIFTKFLADSIAVTASTSTGSNAVRRVSFKAYTTER